MLSLSGQNPTGSGFSLLTPLRPVVAAEVGAKGGGVVRGVLQPSAAQPSSHRVDPRFVASRSGPNAAERYALTTPPPPLACEGVENVVPSASEVASHAASYSAQQASRAQALAHQQAQQQAQQHSLMLRQVILGSTGPPSPVATTPRMRGSLSPHPPPSRSNTPRTSLGHTALAPAPATAREPQQQQGATPSPQRPAAALGLSVGLESPLHLRANSAGASLSGGLASGRRSSTPSTPHPMSPLSISSTPSSRRVSGHHQNGPAPSPLEPPSSSPSPSSPATPASAPAPAKKYRSSLGTPSSSSSSSSVFVFAPASAVSSHRIHMQHDHTPSAAAALAMSPMAAAQPSSAQHKRRSAHGAAIMTAASVAATPAPLKFGKHLSRSVKKAEATLARLAPTPSRVSSLPSTHMLDTLHSPAPLALAPPVEAPPSSSSPSATTAIVAATTLPAGASAATPTDCPMPLIAEAPSTVPAKPASRRLTFSAAVPAAPSQ